MTVLSDRMFLQKTNYDHYSELPRERSRSKWSMIYHTDKKRDFSRSLHSWGGKIDSEKQFHLIGHKVIRITIKLLMEELRNSERVVLANFAISLHWEMRSSLNAIWPSEKGFRYLSQLESNVALETTKGSHKSISKTVISIIDVWTEIKERKEESYVGSISGQARWFDINSHLGKSGAGEGKGEISKDHWNLFQGAEGWACPGSRWGLAGTGQGQTGAEYGSEYVFYVYLIRKTL